MLFSACSRSTQKIVKYGAVILTLSVVFIQLSAYTSYYPQQTLVSDVNAIHDNDLEDIIINSPVYGDSYVIVADEPVVRYHAPPEVNLVTNIADTNLKKPLKSFEPVCPVPLQIAHNVSCERIITGDLTYISKLFGRSFNRSTTDCDLEATLGNCSYLKQHHGYFDKPVTDEERAFPLAFGIKVHKDPIQAEQLLRAIYRPHNVYCIHVDMKSSKKVSEPLRRLSKCLDNVFFIQKYRVVYSSIRQPLSDLECMKTAMKSKVEWKYYLILAAQEYPLKTNLEMVQLLKSFGGTNDIEMYPYPKREAKRFKTGHVLAGDKFQKKLTINKAPFKYNITIYKGSSYATMSREFVKFVLESNVSRELFKWAEDTFAPEEMIWATLNGIPEAPGGYNQHVKMIDYNFLSRVTIWQQYKETCNGKYVRWICIFSFMDLPYLVSAPELIANKFHSDFDQLAIDCLEEWLLYKTMIGRTVNMNWFHYRNAPHMKKWA